MSFEQNFEYIGFNMMQKANENDMCFIMIYKPNENKKEKKDKMKKFKEGIDFLLDDEKEYTEDVIRIFGKYFVEQNKNKCKIIYNNKKYILKEYFDEIDNNYNPKIKEIKIKLNGIKNQKMLVLNKLKFLMMIIHRHLYLKMKVKWKLKKKI